ncbi:organic cation transporter protein [Procambarus clarkii]|uniref:organic cation transporter protein n=1 Tax=Procambarus clarkii TaxID=6728 RepID=UPI0037420BD7
MGSGAKFDDLLTQLGTGKWNLLVFCSVAYWTVQVPYHSMGGAFLTPQTDHRCLPPDGALPLLLNDTNTTTVSKCSYLAKVAGGGVEVQPCTEWSFDNSTYDNSLTSEFELVCNYKSLRPTYTSMYYIGACVASPLNGWLSDRYGRKTMMTFAMIMYIILGNCLSWLPNISALLTLRFIMGLMHPTSLQSGFSLVMEVCEPRYRSTVGILVFLPWALAIMWWGGLAYLIRDWRWLMFTVTIPSFFILPPLWFIDESPRWLMVRGHHDRALQVLEKAARWNNVQLPPRDQLLAMMEDISSEVMSCRHFQPSHAIPLPYAQSTQVVHKAQISYLWMEDWHVGCRLETPTSPGIYKSCGGRRMPNVTLAYLGLFINEFTVLVRTKKMRVITLSVYSIFFTAGLVYLGLSLGGEGYSSDPFVYMALSGVMELPGSTVTIPMINHLGRRLSNIICFTVTGVALLALTFIPASRVWLVMILALVGKLAIAAAYQIIYLHGAELFPTEVRIRGLGTASMVSKLGSILAPYLMDTMRSVWEPAPSLVCGLAGLMAAGVTFLLPETAGAALPDTVAQLEASSFSGSSQL